MPLLEVAVFVALADKTRVNIASLSSSQVRPIRVLLPLKANMTVDRAQCLGGRKVDGTLFAHKSKCSPKQLRYVLHM
jgi:hypothetical protein